VTNALEDYLATSPLITITGFWASPHWVWPGRTNWIPRLQDQEYFANLDDLIPIASSKERIFIEWQTNWTPIPRTDHRRHYPILADPPGVELHPCIQGVLSTGSCQIQCAVFQLATEHCSTANYSIRFRPSAGDRTDCLRCGELYTAHHVLDDGDCYVIERAEAFSVGTGTQSFMSFTGGQKLAQFLHTNQVFLRPLDPVPPAIPPEPDP
jgi:hypothetical protein